ncbi:putative trans-sulfuration enzyme [Cyphellophora attinorum]|uniref:Putative trans-sulfuration enzyme n=1 Tax=Cyphellophora attinorum TaxID=1664694 RepID=A0A0N1H5V3_9EURO|nr:putative trans-sulfuration enzyme [Phialophora attinorum]KPI37895.1 putative trans-sulfuration enzyme [Phialophora attinorum]
MDDEAIYKFRQNLATALLRLAPSTRAVHADDVLNTTDDVAPPVHVSTTFRYPRDPARLRPHHERPSYPILDVGEHCYSRQSTPGVTRLEALLTSIIGHPSITYSSGLASFHALLNFLNPRKVSIGAGYHGCHGTLELYSRASGAEIIPLDCAIDELDSGDLIHLETPVNPTGEALSIQYYADRAHSRGAFLSVDSKFAPPPLQDPFLHGADIVMHSGTKYIGGHSDFLCGILAVKREDWFQKLHQDRLFLGSTMAGFDSWLGTRSMRTLEMRVLRQSQSAEYIVRALHSALSTSPQTNVLGDEQRAIVRRVVKEVHHASLQEDAQDWLRKQMPRGYGPVFALTLREVDAAKSLPSKLLLFHHATSLGGVESLIEWRTMTDSTVSKDFLRVSIGVESPEDLLADLVQGLRAVASQKAKL